MPSILTLIFTTSRIKSKQLLCNSPEGRNYSKIKMNSSLPPLIRNSTKVTQKSSTTPSKAMNYQPPMFSPDFSKKLQTSEKGKKLRLNSKMKNLQLSNASFISTQATMPIKWLISPSDQNSMND